MSFLKKAKKKVEEAAGKKSIELGKKGVKKTKEAVD